MKNFALNFQYFLLNQNYFIKMFEKKLKKHENNLPYYSKNITFLYFNQNLNLVILYHYSIFAYKIVFKIYKVYI
jgi:S-adenosylmethionine:diacylglycerol 3-amino-3-carboxypropyl transferase